MKTGILAKMVLAGAMLAVSVHAAAAPAVVQDIRYEANAGVVTVKIACSGTLQIETFKNEIAPANYIVLDFLGTVFTNLPAVMDVHISSLEKINLIRGEGDPASLGEGYYPLDFIAINLLSKADYSLSQDGTAITIKITSADSGIREAGDKTSDTVQLKPPIVVAKEIAQEKSGAAAAAAPAREKESAAKKPEPKRAEAAKAEAPKPAVIATPAPNPEEPKAGTVQPEKKRRRLLGRTAKQETTANAAVPEPTAKTAVKEPEKKAAAAPPSEAKPEPKSEPKAKPGERDEVAANRSLIDRIVSDAVREKEQSNAHINTLTEELKQLQSMIAEFKTEKTQLEQKLNDLITKADSLNEALDAEIRRRQLLGQRVDDLIAKRELYAKARDAYEQYGRQLEALTQKIDGLNSEATNVKTKLDVVQSEKKKLEQTIGTLSVDFGQLKSEYEMSQRRQEELTTKIAELALQFKKVQEALEKAKQDKIREAAQVQTMESTYKYNEDELNRLRQLLNDRNSLIMDLAKEYDRIRKALEDTNTEKIKAESGFRTAKEEFERLRREVEKLLEAR